MDRELKIYKITNLINNKVYIGLTSQTIQKRFYQHCHNPIKNSLIHKAIKKYGKENFIIECVMDGISSVAEACAWEVFLIDSYDSTNRDIGYNISKGGNVPPSMLGKKRTFSESHKINMRIAFNTKRRSYDGENNPNYGKTTPQETKLLISEQQIKNRPNHHIYKHYGGFQVRDRAQKCIGTYKTLEEALKVRDNIFNELHNK